MSYSVLLVDDNKVFADSFAEQLNTQGVLVDVCYGYQDALVLLNAHEYNVCVFDILLQDGSGLELTRYIMDMHLPTEVILITASDVAHVSMESLMREYIFDYLQKPFEMNHVLKRVQNAAERSVAKVSKIFESERQAEGLKIVGNSVAIQIIRDVIKQLADVPSPVLITGETGTGKELVARSIHVSGKRRTSPFLPVNCSAVPRELFEAEFFGYERGAFTGARSSRKGVFEIATEGTLFLDEIGEMDLNFQSKLLRVLENGEFRKIGGQKSLRSGARVIAATNRDLAEEVKSGRFREDLYYRISVINLEIPPLRERRDDIPLLGYHLWERLSKQLNKKLSLPGNDWFQALAKEEWPGNVRELSNFIERILILGDQPHFSRYGKAKTPLTLKAQFATEADVEPLEQVIRRHIAEAYDACGRNKRKTAAKLKISLSTLKRRLSAMGIN